MVKRISIPVIYWREIRTMAEFDRLPAVAQRSVIRVKNQLYLKELIGGGPVLW